MKIIEYGKENEKVILLLHGGGLSWWNYREVAEHLKNEYHVVIPVLDGHANSDRDFTSIEANASEIISYIDENFAEPLTLSDMAKWCAMSRSEFCKQFFNMSGTTFSHYLNSARIKHAVKLLESNHSITSVQILCGYNDFSTLYRNFKKIMGSSPLQYRKQRFGRN